MTVPAPLSGMCLWSVVLWGLGWAYGVISQPSDTMILHLCSHRNSLTILKVPLGWKLLQDLLTDMSLPSMLIGNGDCFPAHCGGSHVQREGHCWDGSVPALIPKWQLEYYTFSPGVSSWYGPGFSADGKSFISSKQNLQKFCYNTISEQKSSHRHVLFFHSSKNNITKNTISIWTYLSCQILLYCAQAQLTVKLFYRCVQLLLVNDCPSSQRIHFSSSDHSPFFYPFSLTCQDNSL